MVTQILRERLQLFARTGRWSWLNVTCNTETLEGLTNRTRESTNQLSMQVCRETISTGRSSVRLFSTTGSITPTKVFRSAPVFEQASKSIRPRSQSVYKPFDWSILRVGPYIEKRWEPISQNTKFESDETLLSSCKIITQGKKPTACLVKQTYYGCMHINCASPYFIWQQGGQPGTWLPYQVLALFFQVEHTQTRDSTRRRPSIHAAWAPKIRVITPSDLSKQCLHWTFALSIPSSTLKSLIQQYFKLFYKSTIGFP